MRALRRSDAGDETAGFDDGFGPDEDNVDSFEDVSDGRVEDDRAGDPGLGEDLMCLETARESEASGMRRSASCSNSTSTTPRHEPTLIPAAELRRHTP